MRSVRRMLRSYFEMEGNFDCIENIKPYARILKVLKLEKEDVSKLDSEGKIKLFTELMGDFKSNEFHSMGKKYIAEINNAEYVAILSKYIQDDPYATVVTGAGTIRMSDHLYVISNLKSLSEVKAILDSKEFKKNLKLNLPEWTKVVTDKPLINMNKFYYDGSLSISERNEVVKNAVYDACLNMTKIEPVDRFKAIGLLKKEIVALAEINPSDYIKVVNLAHDYGYTTNELLELLNFNCINTIDQYEKYGFTITAQSKTAVKLFDIESDNFIIVNNEDFEMLYKNSLLETLAWQEQTPVVKQGKTIPLSALFDNFKTNSDFRR